MTDRDDILKKIERTERMDARHDVIFEKKLDESFLRKMHGGVLGAFDADETTCAVDAIEEFVEQHDRFPNIDDEADYNTVLVIYNIVFPEDMVAKKEFEENVLPRLLERMEALKDACRKVSLNGILDEKAFSNAYLDFGAEAAKKGRRKKAPKPDKPKDIQNLVRLYLGLLPKKAKD